MNDELVDLAQQTQRRHADLIADAGKRTSLEARVEVRNELEALEQEFTRQALFLTGVEAPYLWLPENPDHAVAIAVRKDILDTEDRLARLAAGQEFQKILSKDAQFGYNVVKVSPGAGAGIGLGLVGVALIVWAIVAGRR